MAIYLYVYCYKSFSLETESVIILSNQMTLFSLASKIEMISFKTKTLSLKPWHTLHLSLLSEINMTDFIYSLACTPSLCKDLANLHSL